MNDWLYVISMISWIVFALFQMYACSLWKAEARAYKNLYEDLTGAISAAHKKMLEEEAHGTSADSL